MLDLDRIQRIRLSARPLGQRFLGSSMLWANYNVLPGVTVEFEHAERLPDEPVIFAMNHTDRYNYWPFQYRLWRELDRFTATWVKGKYYENGLMARFMAMTNNIPTVSRGYLIAKDFQLSIGRAPTAPQYKALRDWVDAAAVDPSVAVPTLDVPRALLEKQRDPLGVEFDPSAHSYAHYINALFGQMMARFVELNVEAFDSGLDLLVFPQGTRSIRLSRGHIGLAQVALRYKKTIVPVGCNGSDKLYPGGSPLAKGGVVTYRFGEALPYDALSEFHIDEDYEPFTPRAELEYRDRFQGCIDVVMDRINDLLDPPYRYSETKKSEGVEGAGRFI